MPRRARRCEQRPADNTWPWLSAVPSGFSISRCQRGVDDICECFFSGRPRGLRAHRTAVRLYSRAGADRPLPFLERWLGQTGHHRTCQGDDRQGEPNFVPPEERIATFDQDGTIWVEHPMYTQVVYCLERVPAVVKAKPELKNVEPFKTVLSGDREAMAKLSMKDLEKILAVTLTGMTVDEFKAECDQMDRNRQASAMEPPLHRADLPADARSDAVPAREWLQDLYRHRRRPGFRARLLRAGYGIPPEQVVGTAGGMKYGYDKDGKPILTKEPKLLLNDNNAGKPEGIHLRSAPGPSSRSAIRPATGRCWNTPRPAMAPGWRCWCCTMTRARICLRTGARTARHEGRHLHPDAL